MGYKKKKVLISFLLILLILLITSTAFAAGTAEDDSAKEDESGGITVWQTFFMLLTVIPVSKMLSSIFMNLVTRVGTVDEDKWAMIGLGAIGATVGLMKRGNVGNIKSHAVKGMSGGPPDPGSVNINSGGGVNPGQMSVNTQAASQPSGMPGITLTPLGGGTSSGGVSSTINAAQSGTIASSPGVPEVGQRSLNDILNISGQSGSKAAGVMAKVGAASAFAVPGVAPVTAGIYAATTKGVAGSSSALYNLCKEVEARSNQNNQSWGQSLMQITGTNNRVTATIKAGSAVALSPFGSRVSNFGTGMLDKGFQKTGDAVQRVRNKIYKP